MKPRIFIDGDEGTTGLQIRARLGARDDLEIVRIDPEFRKDPEHRRRMLNGCDLAILCLPDAAAREAVAMVDSNRVRIIDASTAYRVHPDWAFGFAEMAKDQAERIASAARVSNPGCYSTGAIALIRPLVELGLLPRDYRAVVHGVSGYTGGGRKMIEEFEDRNAPNYTDVAFRYYGLDLQHKHVPEMQLHGRLEHAPLFLPSVARLPQGMIVHLPLHLATLPGDVSVARLREALADYYAGQSTVFVAPAAESASLKHLRIDEMAGSDRMKLYVFGNEARGQAVLAASLDNLGKGASGAAVQNLDIMLGIRRPIH